jgi:hypothetical protein
MTWEMKGEDVTWKGSGSSSGKTGNMARKTKVTSAFYELTHRPTGLTVQGEVPAGSYSKKEMRALKERLFARLFKELEEKVARHLRIPGR